MRMIMIGGLLGLVFFLALFGIIAGLPTAHWLSQKMANFLSFQPTEKLHSPMPLLGRAATLAMNGEINQAADEYEMALVDHPEMKDLYFSLVELAAGPMQDSAYLKNILQRADERLEYRSDFENLLKHANAVKERKLIPLRHLNWCESPDVVHPVVEVPEILKGRFIDQTA